MKRKLLVREITEDIDLRTPAWALNECGCDGNDCPQNLDDEDYDVTQLLADLDKEEDGISQLIDGEINDSVGLNEEDGDGDEDVQTKPDMSDEELKDESLKIAINVAKLMTNVQANDIITIAGTIADFIRNHEIGEGDLENLQSDADDADTEEMEDELGDLNDVSSSDNADAENENDWMRSLDVDSDDDIANAFTDEDEK